MNLLFELKISKLFHISNENDQILKIFRFFDDF